MVDLGSVRVDVAEDDEVRSDNKSDNIDLPSRAPGRNMLQGIGTHVSPSVPLHFQCLLCDSTMQTAPTSHMVSQQ